MFLNLFAILTSVDQLFVVKELVRKKDIKMAKEITDQTFKEETDSGVVLIDFWATWCPPCRMQGPILDEVAKEYEGKAKIVKMDVDANPDTPAQFEVMSIPTLIVKKDGEVVERLVGLHQKPQLEQILNKYL